MLRVVMFDLGATLIDNRDHALPHVRAALEAIMAMRAAGNRPLATCVVSDFTLVPPPSTPAKIKPVFEAFLARFAGSGLQPLFEPVARRVTLSTHAGAMKPQRVVFETALKRLRSTATLAECLFITENASHVAAARRRLGMKALLFRAADATEFDFDDWAEAPALVARLIDPAHAANHLAAGRALLAPRGVEVESVEPVAAGRWRLAGQAWQALPGPDSGAQGPLHVSVPVRGTLQFDPDGRPRVEMPAPDPAQVQEAADFVASLAAHGQIEGQPRGFRGATHAIETDAEGRRRLVRKRFSAF